MVRASPWFKGGEGFLIAMGLLANHRWWRSTKAARAVKQEHREVVAWKAEHAVGAATKGVAGVRSVHLELRIPDPDRPHGAGEVDVIALTDRAVVLLEVKNWSGEIDLVDGDLVQARQTARGQAPKPVISKLEAKASNLKRCSLSADGVELFEVLSLVVMANGNAELSEAVMAHPHVCMLADLKAHLEGLLAPLDQTPEAELLRQEALLGRLATWDVVTFDGGERKTGDLIDADLPEGWSRATTKAVEVRLERGWLGTVVFGPLLRVTHRLRDGTTREEVVQPGPTLRHSEPWASSGIDGRGTYPIEHLRKVSFGFLEAFDFGGRTRLDETGAPLEEVELEEAADALLARFEVGSTYPGTVVKHLHGKEDGVLFGVLVALVEQHVVGMLHISKLEGMNPELFAMMYDVGRTVDVVVLRKDSARKVSLGLPALDEEA